MNIRTALLFLAAAVSSLGWTSCSSHYSQANSRGGLLSRQHKNYSQSTVTDSEREMAASQTIPRLLSEETVTEIELAITESGFVTEDTAAAVAAEVTLPDYNFQRLELEHVKYSYYDPFGEGNSTFALVLEDQEFCYPYEGKFLSGYGFRGRAMHTGIDIKGAKDDTIRAAFSGTVRMSRLYSSYGNCVVIRHPNGLETLYSHNSKNLVKAGDKVQAGDPIALMGRTGRATTEHLHFEVRIQGQHINPALLVDYNNYTLKPGVLLVSTKNGVITASNDKAGIQSAPVRQQPAAVAAPAQLASNNSGGSPAARTGTHTVQKGDTLWAIARKYNTTVAKLCDLNQIDRETILKLGSKLKVN